MADGLEKKKKKGKKVLRSHYDGPLNFHMDIWLSAKFTKANIY